MERESAATPPYLHKPNQTSCITDCRAIAVEDMVLKKSFRVLRRYKPRSVLLESKEIEGETLLFESNTIATLTPAEAEMVRKEYGEALAAYCCLGVLQVAQGDAVYHYLVLVTDCQSVGKVRDVEVFRITQTTFAPFSSRANLELVQEVGKLLASGQFFFAWPSYGAQFDLLACAQKQGKEQRQFFWNRALYSYMQRFGVDCRKWLVRVMCGSVEIQTVYAGDKQAKACLFSRLNCERAGTRLTTRGTDDNGHVGNFVETEQAIFVESSVASFVQIRGGVPLFWEQPGLQTSGGMIKIKFSRGPVCSTPAFERHFEWLLLHYGPVLCVNLLGTRNQEQMLSKAYCDQFQHLSSAYCAEMACFDYHKFCKGQSTQANMEGVFLPMATNFFSTHGFFVQTNAETQRRQTGMIRTNCLDCLDRSNSVQTFLGLKILVQLMTDLGLQTKQSVVSRFQATFKQAWVRNGDNISLLYAGTRAMGGTEGKGLKLKDGARSVQRTIFNNFLDKSKNEAIEMLLLCNARSGDLGQKAVALLDTADVLAPLNFKQAMLERWSEYTVPEKLRVCIGTWNVNGGKHIHSIALRNQSMHDWLLDAPFIAGTVKEHPEEFAEPPDIFALGFQELVGLTASNIVSASSTNRKEWATELQKVLSRDTKYELLTAEQMVGICLYIFIRPKLIPFIRDVAVSTIKTGMSGKAGNKGGVVVRFLLHSTSLCFVCSHLAAHQTKVAERNQDVQDICSKVQFPHGQTLESHDYVFWCGDLNYRIDLPTNVAKEHISGRRWEKLVPHDQLTKQRKMKKVFRGFVEGAMTFAPTYKYDQFSDDYDTSEKCRTPAWCDRILWRRKPLVTDPSADGMTSRTSQVSMASVSPDDLEGSGEREETPSPTTSWDFGLHPNDAGKVYRREMEGGGGGDLVNTGHPWHPGRLLFYGRAELKQSDHRPVVALLEVDMYRVDRGKRLEVREEVGLLLGPSDPTVVISEPEGDCVEMNSLVESVKKYGEVVLVRATEENILVTFKDSKSAMAATALSGERVEGVKIEVSLRTPWPLAEDTKGVQGDSGVPESSETPPPEGVVSRQPRGDKPLRNRLSLLAVTPDDECDQEMGSEVNNDELLEFSFAGEAPPIPPEEVGDEEEENDDENGMEPETDETGGMEPGQEEGAEPSSTSSSDLEEATEREREEEAEEEERESPPVTLEVNSPSPEPANATSMPSPEKPIPRPRSFPTSTSPSRSPVPSPAHSPTPQRPPRRQEVAMETSSQSNRPAVPQRPSRPPAPQRPHPPTRPHPPATSPGKTSVVKKAPPSRPARPPNRPPPPPHH